MIMVLEAIPFNKSEHISTVNEWREGWDLPKLHPNAYPEIGYIVPEVAVAFLYVTGTTIAFYENVISNKESTKEDRHEALRLIDKSIENVAEIMGIRAMIGKSSNKSLIKLSEDLGWQVDNTPIFSMIKKVGDGKGVITK